MLILFMTTLKKQLIILLFKISYIIFMKNIQIILLI